MKAVILAGGLGTRIAEETGSRPKPMVEIGGRPLLWHIMKILHTGRINNFIVCCGYKGYVIKEYFANYFLHMSDVTFDMEANQMIVHQRKVEPWKVTLVDTGEGTGTAGRLKLVSDFIKDEQDFLFTYGDGLSDINIESLIAFHRGHGRLATVTAVQPPGRYGALEHDDSGLVKGFIEKPPGDEGKINGGYFVLSPKCVDFISSVEEMWEDAPIKGLVRCGELMAYRHQGFWHAVDTLRDRLHLEEAWRLGHAEWKTWE